MDYKIVVKRLAEQDISDALDWYLRKSNKLAGGLIMVLNEAMESIRENPELYQERYERVRVFFTNSFSYGIYYTIEEDIIIVHAVLHTKRDPQSGIQRI